MRCRPLAGWTSAGPRQRRQRSCFDGHDQHLGRERRLQQLLHERVRHPRGCIGIIGGGPDNGTSSLSQTFTLPGTITAGTVSSYDLTIDFRTVFDGRDDQTPRWVPTCSWPPSALSLCFPQSSTVFPNNAPNATSANNQLANKSAQRPSSSACYLARTL